jgi:hypothetical protein
MTEANSAFTPTAKLGGARWNNLGRWLLNGRIVRGGKKAAGWVPEGQVRSGQDANRATHYAAKLGEVERQEARWLLKGRP